MSTTAEVKKESLPVPAEPRPAPVPFDARENLTTVASQLAALDKIGEYFGNSGLCGARSKAQGVVIAIFGYEHHMPMTDVPMKYHLITGRGGGTSLSIKGHQLVTNFQDRGGIHQVKESTEKSCTIYDKAPHRPGQPEIIDTLTIEEARKAGWVKSGGAWETNPKRQLYIRLSVNNIMRVDPGAADGAPVMEENEAPGEPVDDQTPSREEDNDLSKRVKIEVTTPAVTDAPHGTFDGKGEHAAAQVATDDGPKPVPTPDAPAPTEQDATATKTEGEPEAPKPKASSRRQLRFGAKL